MNTSQVLTGDCLDVLPGFPAGSVDLVYVDPPFNTGRDWGEFNDQWRPPCGQGTLLPQGVMKVLEAAQPAGGPATSGYLAMMAPRLLELHRVLKPSGSIYLHCDPTESHYLKLAMDAVFGKDNFPQRNHLALHQPPAKGRISLRAVA